MSNQVSSSVKLIAVIDQASLASLLELAKTQHLRASIGTVKLKNCFEKVYGYKSNYCSMKIDANGDVRHRITKQENREFISQLGDKYLPNWNQCNLRKFDKDGSVDWMSSHGIFFPSQVIICLSGIFTISIASGDNTKPPWKVPTNYEKVVVNPGEVILFDSKRSHKMWFFQESYIISFQRFIPHWEKYIPGSSFLDLPM